MSFPLGYNKYLMNQQYKVHLMTFELKTKKKINNTYLTLP